MNAFILLVFVVNANTAVGDRYDTRQACIARAWAWAQDRHAHDLELGITPAIVFGPLGAVDGDLQALCYKATEVPGNLKIQTIYYSTWTPPWIHPPQVAWAGEGR